MPASPHFCPSVLAGRERLATGRDKLRTQHQRGSPGIQVCSFLTDLLDTVVLDIYESALRLVDQNAKRSLRRDIALVPHGGYGRRDAAPYSDVDLMLLHRSSVHGRVTQLAKQLLMDLNDAGLDLGFSVRTPSQACNMAKRDPIIFSSQAEARYLSGSVRLFSAFMRRYRRLARRRCRSLIQSIDNARREERVQYGETVFLLEPNIKRSRGSLRDVHLLRWVGFARYGESDPKSLRLMGVLGDEDERNLRKATEFLLRLRNEMHFHSGKQYDVLNRSEQVRIAQLWNYQGQEGVLPVEQFMRDYFEHTTNVRNIASSFLATARPYSAIASAASPLIAHSVEGNYRVGPAHIAATRRGRQKLRSNLVEVLRLMDLASQYDKRIHPQTWSAIREDMMSQSTVEVTDSAAQRFLSLISQMPRLGEFLRKLHELRVLEKFLAGMDHARCLLQFNRYHKYTVDEHCIRAVEQATKFLADTGPVGRVYRRIDNRALLHLALLVHDLGKGYKDDHSDVGARLATETARRLKLKERDTEILEFLVHKHLLMSHLAFRRDTSDQSAIVEFAAEVGSTELLRMLFVLTCADFAAVGPGVLNPWKVDVLSELYDRARQHLSGAPSPSIRREVEEKRGALLASIPATHADWYRDHISALPAAYLLGCEPPQLIEDLERLRRITPDEAVAWGRYIESRRAIEFTVGAHEELIPGIFHRLTGVLTSHRMQILEAEIHSLPDNLVLDRFYVHDGDYVDQPPQERLKEVSTAMERSLTSPQIPPPSFRPTWQTDGLQALPGLEFLPTRIRFDTSTSPKYTIIDVFAHDRLGLLYAIARTLFELGMSVRIAKIGTYLDQVVDVFYVTDASGNKIVDEGFLKHAEQTLLDAIEEYK